MNILVDGFALSLDAEAKLVSEGRLVLRDVRTNTYSSGSPGSFYRLRAALEASGDPKALADRKARYDAFKASAPKAGG